MAVSFFDENVVDGFMDPEVDNATPGAVLVVPQRAPYLLDSGISTLVRGNIPANRLSTRFPPAYIQGSDDAFVTLLNFESSSVIALRLSTVDDDLGRESGPELTDEAESSIGIAVRVVGGSGDGNTYGFLLSDFVDTDRTEPYIWRNIPDAAALNTDLRRSGAQGQAIFVDTADPNVDFDSLQFNSLTAVREPQGAEDRGLLALVEGTIYLTLHVGAVPTGANTVSGGSYAPIEITDDLWTLSTVEGLRRIANNVKHTFPRPTAGWGTVRSMALWTAPPASAGAQLLWHAPTLPYSPRPSHTEVSADVGDIAIEFRELPN